MEALLGGQAMTVEGPVLVGIGLLLAAWTSLAAAALMLARVRSKRLQSDRKSLLRLSRIVDESPALPLLVRSDGRIEGPDRLAAWFGFDRLPDFLKGLASNSNGIPESEVDKLWDEVRRTQASAAPFRMLVHPANDRQALSISGHLADPQIAPGGAVLLWIFDISDTATEIARLTEEASRSRSDFAALIGLIEAAPVPMWFRAPDGRLRLVNSAYVAAVGAENAEEVVNSGIELVEPVEGLSAREVAQQARQSNRPIERNVMATIDGARRALRVSDLPVGEDGVAGYAIDVEDLDQLAREYRAFRAAQRALLDQMSSGVAQFDANRNLIFLNQPMQRIFRLSPGIAGEAVPFTRVLDLMRDLGRLPEVRDFPAWRREHEGWFTASSAQDEEWVLGDGTHLRVMAQPMPDGGLMTIVEDRTEQLKLASARDTLLRTRSATLDTLFEGLLVLAPNGHLQLWNRRFAEEWSLKERFLATHPHIDAVLRELAPRLADPQHAERLRAVIEAATLRREQANDRVTLADGRTLALMGVPLPDGNGMLTSLDITDSQKAEAALLERNAALVEADAVKTRFLANMSYEFRTPLTSIIGFAEMLHQGVAGDLTETGRDYVGAILDSTTRLSDQIESVLDLTQSEAGLLPLADEDVEMMPLLTALVQERAARIEAGGLTLNLRGDRSAGIVHGDSRRLSRAIGNVLDNAISSAPRSGRIDVEVRRRSAGLRIQLAYAEDPEAGESEAARQHAGLGVPLARELIEAHGGTLEFAETGQNRMTATISLP